jgi:hypothetical protein
MNRYKAGLTHLALSAAVASAIFLPIYFLWFPDILFEQAGGRDLFLLIASVDVTLGPLITFIIFVPGKRGLMFDLVVIATLQLAALGYGVWVLFESRPVYIVFVKDRFELVRASAVNDESLEKARAKGAPGLSITGPRLAGARIPKDADEQFRIMMSGFGGIDLQGYPQYHVPYDEVRDEVRAKAAPLAKLRTLNPGREAEIDAAVSNLSRKPDQVGFLPLRAGKVDLTVFVDAKSGDFLKMSSLRPWEY